MQKAVVIKQTWAIILMTPHYTYWKQLKYACVYIAARRLDSLYTRGGSFSKSG